MQPKTKQTLLDRLPPAVATTLLNKLHAAREKALSGDNAGAASLLTETINQATHCIWDDEGHLVC